MTSRVRFVHAADLHLDAPFSGIAATDARVGAALADATYEAFHRVVDVCIEREAAFLVIAGDAYNSADKSLRAQLRFRAEMERLAEAGVDVFIANGNHDPQSGWSAGLELPGNVHIFATGKVDRYEVVRAGETVAVVYGRSFARAVETDNFALGYKRAVGDPVAVGVLHANVGGNVDYDPYAPASLDDLRGAGMDYWALGHIHKQEVLAENPWIVYAGSPQGLNPKETGPHGCLVVDVGTDGAAVLEHVETGPVSWARLDVDVSTASGIDGVRNSLVAALDEQRVVAGRHCVVRVSLSGRSAAHADLARPLAAAQLLEDVRSEAALAEPWLWLDRLDDLTSPSIDLDALRGGPDFAAELVRISDELASDPASLAALVDEVATPVASTLAGYTPSATPPELLERARDAALDLLLTQGGDVR